MPVALYQVCPLGLSVMMEMYLHCPAWQPLATCGDRGFEIWQHDCGSKFLIVSNWHRFKGNIRMWPVAAIIGQHSST